MRALHTLGGARCFIKISCGLELLSLPFPLTFSTILIVKLSVQNRPHTYNKQTYRDHVHSPQIGELKLHGTNTEGYGPDPRQSFQHPLRTPISEILAPECKKLYSYNYRLIHTCSFRVARLNFCASAFHHT